MTYLYHHIICQKLITSVLRNYATKWIFMRYHLDMPKETIFAYQIQKAQQEEAKQRQDEIKNVEIDLAQEYTKDFEIDINTYSIAERKYIFERQLEMKYNCSFGIFPTIGAITEINPPTTSPFIIDSIVINNNNDANVYYVLKVGQNIYSLSNYAYMSVYKFDYKINVVGNPKITITPTTLPPFYQPSIASNTNQDFVYFNCRQVPEVE